MTESIYTAVHETAESERQICVSRMLEILGVSKSGYYAWLNRKPSSRSKRKAEVIDAIKKIYDNSKCIYGAPKITAELHRLGFNTSESTVTKYMREIGIRACWVKPYTVTTHSEDFSDNLRNILSKDFSPKDRTLALNIRTDGSKWLGIIMSLASAIKTSYRTMRFQ